MSARKAPARARAVNIMEVEMTDLRPLIPPKKARPPFDGVASLVVDRGAGTGLGPNFWSYRAWVL